MVDERTHTDVLEKIVELPKQTIYIDDVTDIEKITNIHDITENQTDISDITKRKNLTSITSEDITNVIIDKDTTNITKVDEEYVTKKERITDDRVTTDDINITRKTIHDRTDITDLVSFYLCQLQNIFELYRKCFYDCILRNIDTEH